MRLSASVGLAALLLAGQASAEPLKIALIEAVSGPAAQTGLVFSEGMKYIVDGLNAGGGFNGTPIELKEYDNLGGPTGASEKFKLAVADGAQVISSASSSAIAAQLTEDVRRYNMRNPGKELIYFNMSEASELTAAKCHFWYFRASTQPFSRMKALITVMNEQGALGKKVYSINQNYSYGLDQQAAQKKYVEQFGSQIIEQTLHDVNKIQDFSPYVAKIKASGADTVLTGNWANDIILLMKAMRDADLKLAFGSQTIDTPGVLAAAGPAALNGYLVQAFSLDAGGDAGKKFVSDFKAKFGREPTPLHAIPLWATTYLGAALKLVDFKGGAIDTKALALALEKASIDTPVGKFSMRKEDHTAQMALTVSRVTKDAAYKSDGTDMGFKLVRTVTPEETAVEVSPDCKMERPQ